ncbi:acyltransferase family protein [Oscillospiraceae bacterium CM]|nr:acyltransferase family protein [Oscillospiraceae bacterium CM]
MEQSTERKRVDGRLLYIDLLRIISCFAVIIIHVSASNQYSVSVASTAWKAFNVYDGLARFAVPVFVMISGAMNLNPDKPFTFKELFKRRLLKITIAWAVWELFYAFVDFIWRGAPVGPTALLDFLETAARGHYHLWFLPMLIGLYLTVPILRAVTEKRDKNLVLYAIILFFLFSVLKPALMLLQIPEAVKELIDRIPLGVIGGYAGYFLLGYYLGTYPVSRRATVALAALGLLGAGATVFITALRSEDSGVTYGLMYDFMSLPVFFLSVGVFLLFQKAVPRLRLGDKTVKRITSLAACTLGIYLVHAFVTERVYSFGLTTLSFNAAFSVPLIAVLDFVVSWLIVVALRRIPFAKKYLT